MKGLLICCGTALVLTVVAPAAAQDTSLAAPVLPAQPVPAIAPVADLSGNAVLRVGTQVPLRLLHEITTQGKNLHVGDRVRMEVAEPVIVQGVTVIPSGTPAVGEITDVRNKGMWGRSGKFTARLLYLTVNGRQIRLSGGFDDKGVSGGVGAVAVSAIVFLPAGFFMTGTSAQLPAGAIVQGFIDEDVPLAIQSAVPAPLSISAPAPVLAEALPAAPPEPDGATVADGAADEVVAPPGG